MNIVIHSRETLVFRDGRPFGDPGHVNGGMLSWPWPSTVVGMLRSRIGLSRDKSIFQTKNGKLVAKEKVKALNSITAGRIIPVWQPDGAGNEWQYLFPAPADALVHKASGENNYSISGFEYENPSYCLLAFFSFAGLASCPKELRAMLKSAIVNIIFFILLLSFGLEISW